MVSKTVLTVDDSTTILRSLKVVLEGAGYWTVQAGNRVEALELEFSSERRVLNCGSASRVYPGPVRRS